MQRFFVHGETSSLFLYLLLLLFMQWLGKHQEFSSNPFYVAGDSYSGLVVPATVQEISKGIYGIFNINPTSPFLNQLL